MEYKVIANESISELIKGVNKALDQGWELYEGLVIGSGAGCFMYTQAVTYHEYEDAGPK